jgi:tetratricopeptide (TPR) repeat protein
VDFDAEVNAGVVMGNLLLCLAVLAASVMAAENAVASQGEAALREEATSLDRATRAGTISADLLRHPLSAQARERIDKAQRSAQAGDHLAAIQQLTKALAQHPESAAWIQPVLGVEYLKTDQHEAAIQALEQAVVLLPRDPINRSNLGLCLAFAGQFDRAEQELQRALQLDAKNDTTRRLLAVVEANHRLRHHE